MLTKQDLQQIGEVVTEKLKPIEEKVSGIEGKVDKLEKGVNSLKRSVKKVAKDQNAILGFLSKEDVELRKRVDKIEDHLNLPSQ